MTAVLLEINSFEQPVAEFIPFFLKNIFRLL
jgi:hypothetical protein